MTKPKAAPKYVTMRALAASEARITAEIDNLRAKLAATPWRAEFEVLNLAIADLSVKVQEFSYLRQRVNEVERLLREAVGKPKPAVIRVTLKAEEGEEDY